MKRKQFLTGFTLAALAAVTVLSAGGCSGGKKAEGGSGETVDSFRYYGMATGLTTEEYNQSPIAKLVEEHTGYKVAYDQQPADTSDAQNAITNIFMTRSDYQAVIVSKNQFYSLLAMDALKDITPYVDQSVNLKDQISGFGWDTAKKNGSIYGIPVKDARKSSDVGIAFREDWLREYNAEHPDAAIDVPSKENGYTMTASDFKTMLTYFKTKVPKGGKAMNVDVNGVFLENILPAFGIEQQWVDVDGKLEYYINQPGFEDYMDYMQGLFDEGLISYQATSGDPSCVKLLQARTIGAGRIPHWNAVTIEKSDAGDVDDGIGYISVLVPDEYKGQPDKVKMFAREAYAYYTVIPKYASDAQAAAVVDWADKKLEKDFFLNLVLGKENETFTIKNGEYYPILPQFDEQRGIADKFLDGTREEDYSKYWLCRTRKTPAQDKMFSRINYNIDKYGVKDPTTVMPPNDVYDNYFSGAVTEVTTALIKSLYQSESRPSLGDVQQVFKANKGDEITDAVNSWYTSWTEKDQFQ